ncbi:SDR family oxidoreductase [Nannocystis sp. SCPEA4]|uniref:SDR family NAD(P)-dependent oxidoreductase n=1 Tax=Nannocystis sp. SCPEA4 TaxID=2996787 RepID=UPI002271EAF3|nr:SDR family oxidoreductase [Nannocystis sp. SCPEA4]MCY1055964.1 SDR family oxidoreductase [Nannocystis sp. SCPEA4]
MDLGLQHKVAIVTGGSEGIGRATARALGLAGARVVICARRADVLAKAMHELSSETGSEVLAMPVDVREPADVMRLVDGVMARLGRIDILVNNAGTSAAAAFESLTDDAWQDDLDLKLFAALRLSRLAIPHMRAVGGGSIVNLLNIGARQPAAGSMPSTVSRAAGLALTKALSKELAPDKIRVNAVLIGLVKSAQHDRKRKDGVDPERYYADMARQRQVPLGRVGEAEEAADLIAFLSSARAAFITGTAINFDGGASAVP